MTNLVEVQYAQTGKSSNTDELVCTHATLLNSLNGIDARKLDNVFFGIDEFNHGSADEDKRSEKLTDEEAILLFTKLLPKWREENPDKTKLEITDGDPLARRIAMAIEHLRQLKRNKLAQQQ